eukprot:scaffold376244_cov47-Attheya_sp.AAC.1
MSLKPRTRERKHLVYQVATCMNARTVSYYIVMYVGSGYRSTKQYYLDTTISSNANLKLCASAGEPTALQNKDD